MQQPIDTSLTGIPSTHYIWTFLKLNPLFIFIISNHVLFVYICNVFINSITTFCRENKNLTGTARYASCNTHLGIGKKLRIAFTELGTMIAPKKQDLEKL